MATLFISHSSEDAQLTGSLVGWLRAEGFDALFVDVDAQQGLVGGRSWERELYAQLRMADAVIFLGTPASARSRWCFAEVTLARSIGRPVIPVLAAGEERLGLLEDVQWVDLRRPTAEALGRLTASMQAIGIDARDSFPWSPTRAPYPGLESFGAEDAGVFFGRGKEIAELQERMQPTMQRARGQFLAVVGPSGSGKSSLVAAGLLPRLGRMPDRWIVVPPFVPGQHPATQLARSLVRAFAAVGQQWDPAVLEHQLIQPGGLSDLAHRLVDASGRSARPAVLLFMDQAEELISRTLPAEAAWFLDMLQHSLHRESPLWVVTTLRSEFLGPLIAQIGAANSFDETYVVGPLTRSQLPAIIERPAQRAGITFEPGLVQRMVEDAVGGDSLPLLAFTLRQLYERLGSGRHVSHADYEAVGGVVGALRRQADSVVAQLGRRHPHEAIFATLLLLISVEHGREPVRRRVWLHTLRPDQLEIVQALVDARLLLSHDIGTGTVVEVTHEALLRQWEPLRATIETSRRGLETRSEIELITRSWQESARDESFLPRGVRLNRVADEFGPAFTAELSPVEREFLAASQAYDERAVSRARRANRRLRFLVAGLALLVLVAAGFAVYAVRQRQTAQDERAQALEQQRIATSRQLIAQADTLADSDPQTSIRLNVAAQNVHGDDIARNALADRLATTRQRAALAGHSKTVRRLAATPDGKLVVSAGLDGTIRVWNVSDRLRPVAVGAPINDGAEKVWSVAISADGRLLASAATDGIRLREIADPTKVRLLPAQEKAGAEVAFAPTGDLLASGGTNGSIVLWKAPSVDGARQVGETSLGRVVYALAIGRTGVLAAAGPDATFGMWNVKDPAQPVRLKLPASGHEKDEDLESVAFSADGTMVATTGDDDQGVLWDVSKPSAVKRLGEPFKTSTNRTYSLAFAPSGATLVTGSGDEALTLWDISDPKRPEPIGSPLRGHSGSVDSMVFLPGEGDEPDGATLASSGEDGKLLLWDLSDRATPARLNDSTTYVEVIASLGAGSGKQRWAGVGNETLSVWETSETARPHRIGSKTLTGGLLRSVAATLDAQTVATGGEDKEIRLWSLADPSAPVQIGDPISGLETTIWRLAFSPDGQVLAAATDYHVLLFDVSDLAHPRAINAKMSEAGFVKSLAFTPDGRFLATATTDKTVLFWDLSVLDTPKAVSPRLPASSDIFGIAVSPDGKLLAAGGRDGTVTLWNIADMANPRRAGAPLPGGAGIVWSVAFSPDGGILATGRQDRTIQLWDVRDPARARLAARVLTGPQRVVESVQFAADGRSIAAESGYFWSVSELYRLRNDSAEAGCRLTTRGLDEDEWARFIPDLPYVKTCP